MKANKSHKNINFTCRFGAFVKFRLTITDHLVISILVIMERIHHGSSIGLPGMTKNHNFISAQNMLGPLESSRTIHK